ncbi:MAG: PorT family protein [Bacteroidia bacterium]|nr:PorT family protein [Bacteroidia bacterium]
MKKMTFLLACFIIALNNFSLFSQTQISVVTGFHTSNTKSEMTGDLVTLSQITNFSAGLMAERKLDDILTLMTGVIYRKKGFSMNESTGVDVLGLNLPLGVKLENEINYIDVPLMLKYYIDNSSPVQPYIAVGPSLGYALSGTLRTKATAILDFTVATIDMNLSSNDYNRLDVSGNVLAGVNIPYGNGNVIAEIGYGHSFNNFINQDFIIDAGGKHHGWSMNIGYGMKF